MTNEHASGLRIGELAHRAGVTLRTLRYYEALGLIQPVPRRSGGFRFYDEATLQRLQRIQQLKELLGFTLDEVRRILTCEDAVAALRIRYQETEDAKERAAIVREAIAQTERQALLVKGRQDLLADMRRTLDERLARYRDVLKEIEER